MSFFGESEILGHVEIINVYYYYDGPVLFTCYSNGLPYLAMSIKDGDRTQGDTWDEYLLLGVSWERIKEMEDLEITLYDMFKQSESGYCARVITDWNVAKVEILKSEDIPDDWLSQQGLYLYPKSKGDE